MTVLEAGAPAPENADDGASSATEVDYRAYIETLAARKIRGFCGTIDDDGTYLSEIYAAAASVADSVTADYHGRFLIELIQNAHDVHPEDRCDGQIEVLFDRRVGDNGTLFIANHGCPFTRRNVKALCDMGLSSKPPGESIGNKGLGFRSVHHITDTPLIYSQASKGESTGRFEGYCFGFADNAELDRLIPDPQRRELAERDLPLFHVPSWLDDQPTMVTEFARRGFATVIRLPLRDADASEAVSKEIAAIRDQTVPMLLFLSRLASLSIRIIGDSGEDTQLFDLTRSEKAIPDAGVTLSVADLGSSGRYLMARRKVSEAAMRKAIKDGTDRKQLHKHWLKWAGEGDVAIAVRLDAPVATPRLYTFLPMGEQAAAPFAGYLHGSFFPISNRTGLDASVKVNALLLDQATGLAALAIRWLTSDIGASTTGVLDPPALARAVVDLLSWRKVDSLETTGTQDLPAQVALLVAKALAAPTFDGARVVPCLSSSNGAAALAWCAPAAARHWRYELETFPAEIAAAHTVATGFSPIWPGLGLRLDPLRAFLIKHAKTYTEAPSPQERAALATEIAAELDTSKGTAIARWTAYYRDLAILLEKSGGALSGRIVLLGADGSLHQAMKPPAEIEGVSRRRRSREDVEISIFSPPARQGAGSDDEDELTPPDALAGNFAFLSSQLDWYGELSDAREFLERSKLVFPFDRENVLAQLSRVVRLDPRNVTRSAGLRWAFQIWRQPRDKGRPFKLQPQHRFFVPTMSQNFIEAGQAIFSESWPDETHGRLLQRFLNSAPADSEDLTALAARRIAGRDHYAFKGAKGELWTAFLIELGVQQGLRPLAKKVAGTVTGLRVQSMSFCTAIGIPPEAASAWKADIVARSPSATNLQLTGEYYLRGDIWWLPGQGDIKQFNRECREFFAQLIIAWLGQGAMPTWTIDVHHHHYVHADSRDWPTPLASFLRSEAWIPADEPSTDGARAVVVTPSDIWLTDTTERFPSFLRRPAAPVMRALEKAGQNQIRTLTMHASLRVLNAAETLMEQAGFLAQQYAREGFGRYFERHLINLYHHTWTQIASRVAAGELDLDDKEVPRPLIVRRGHESEVIDPVAAVPPTEPIYVRDNDDETIASLVEASGRLLFDPRSPNPARIGALMRRLYGRSIRLLSEAQYSMIADGEDIGGGDTTPIVDRCPRLRALIAVAMEALKGTELQRLPSDRHSVIARLDRLAFQSAASISFRIDGVDVGEEIDGRPAFALKLPDGQPIVVVRASGAMSWQVVSDALGAICEAIEQTALEPHLRLLIHALVNDNAPVGEEPSLALELEDLCDVLRLGMAARRTVRETLGARLERHVPWLRALLYMAGGMDAVDTFAAQEAGAVKDIARLRDLLSPWLQILGRDADTVLDACKNALSIGEFRELLALDFEALNLSLVAVGQKPDTYPDLHASLVANYVHENELAIIDALRSASAARLAQGDPDPAYAIARDAVHALAPDPDWLLRHREVPGDKIRDHIDAWLVGKGSPILGAATLALEPLEEVRRNNVGALRKLAAAANPLVRAWCAKASVAVPEGWKDADGGLATLRAALDKAGIFELRTLDEADLLKWIAKLGYWPKDMRLSLDRVELEIVEADFNAEKVKARSEAEARRKDARSIPFNGRKVDPEDVDWQVIAGELAATLSKKMLATRVGSQAKLLPAREKTTRPGAPGAKTPSSNPPPPRAPSQKTDMIGRLGELAVYQWLGLQLPKQDIDTAWQSGNAKLFTGREGSDSLGYDFEVSFRGQLWQIEVKASLNDPCAFQIGETEVRAGRAAARARSGVQYWIAYVSNLSVPGEARVEMLPNPMGEEGEAVLNLLGEGLRYGFRRS
ncbi:MAG: hypothetical protein JWR80_6015 [Bradyrhizobium sp.]|nr:hypothetical protein [Bradyrhizobium sp.]